MAEHIDEVQTALGRTILLENPSSYVRLVESTIPEVDFLAEVSRRTGCGLLLDVNNVFVSAKNNDAAPLSYLDSFPLDRVREIHLGGHHEAADDTGSPLLIDAHGTPVADAVWTLYAQVITRTGPIPTLIEWDNDVPDWPTLRDQAVVAENISSQPRARQRRDSEHAGVFRGVACAGVARPAGAGTSRYRGDGRGSPARRFAIHRNNVVVGLIKVAPGAFSRGRENCRRRVLCRDGACLCC